MNNVEETLGAKWKEILDASVHLAAFQCLVGHHQLTGQDIAKGMKLLNVNEQVLEARGAKV